MFVYIWIRVCASGRVEMYLFIISDVYVSKANTYECHPARKVVSGLRRICLNKFFIY